MTASRSAMHSNGSTIPVEFLAPKSKAKTGTVKVPIVGTPVLDIPMSSAQKKKMPHSAGPCTRLEKSGMVRIQHLLYAVYIDVTVVVDVVLAGGKFVLRVRSEHTDDLGAGVDSSRHTGMGIFENDASFRCC